MLLKIDWFDMFACDCLCPAAVGEASLMNSFRPAPTIQIPCNPPFIVKQLSPCRQSLALLLRPSLLSPQRSRLWHLTIGPGRSLMPEFCVHRKTFPPLDLKSLQNVRSFSAVPPYFFSHLNHMQFLSISFDSDVCSSFSTSCPCHVNWLGLFLLTRSHHYCASCASGYVLC